MRAANPSVDPVNVVQALVYTLLDVFDATRDLHQTLRVKEKREYEQSLRAKGYPSSRRIEYVEDDEFDGDEAIVMDKAAIKRQYELGCQEIGTQFAVGDVLSHTALQSQIITLQSVLVTTFLYGPTSSSSVSHQLSNLGKSSRTAGTTCVDILAAQQQRQRVTLPSVTRSRRSTIAHTSPTKTLLYPTTINGASSVSTTLVESRHEPLRVRSGSPANTTILEWQSQLKPERADTDITSLAGSTSYGVKSASPTLYCPYALDLQRYRDQSLSSCITSNPSPYCPDCKRTLHLSSGKAWELFKNDKDGFERCFQVSNRFAVKCHRDGANGGYSCVLCSENASVETVCGDVKALIKHIWEDHDASELKREEDITEVIESIERRRDSGLDYDAPRSSRRSGSWGSRRRPSRPDIEREVEALEIRRSSRR
ncbi:hypothetical protein P153DRAFT_311407 [Dothidotthia symphoricarpi CBS 119687]|uniref:Uncharacterized protein n=1 Tax=Dothidotthia symphoricarpi CBS 119687 TaxID=1392245 RepID=A0A6A6AML1_9PLEO|nr:uncharacterized protein P153DRAFT_311407 [Dothidotthia symphoricarpi CBS 119687]KAF2132413.1 hypothetical protein P153DRAFT_311407 [Dothidotthia symphoricarpi CBS 119687]